MSKLLLDLNSVIFGYYGRHKQIRPNLTKFIVWAETNYECYYLVSKQDKDKYLNLFELLELGVNPTRLITKPKHKYAYVVSNDVYKLKATKLIVPIPPSKNALHHVRQVIIKLDRMLT